MLTHLSLFSGIGGLDLAAEWAGFTTVGQCEWAEYPTRVLEKHWPDVPRWKDVRDVTADSFNNRTGIDRPTVISAGFPCQPHSSAGKRLAAADERDLWPELRRILGEIRPRWFVGENVRGLLSSDNGRFFAGVLRDLAGLGYDVGWCCYGADLAGAPHQRKRIFITAHSKSERRHGGNEDKQTGFAGVFEQIVSASFKQNSEDDILPPVCWRDMEPVGGVLRNDDGISEGVDRLECLGNAVVPQQAYPIFRAIWEIEETEG